tara:strand:+ start:7288 stop:8667 length:1380 start_codon:yes stop_codon:yes gene_type:complete
VADPFADRLKAVEAAMIAAMLGAEDQAGCLVSIQPEDFAVRAYGDLWRVCRSIRAERGSVDELALAVAGDTPQEALKEVLRLLPGSGSVEHHVREFAAAHAVADGRDLCRKATAAFERADFTSAAAVERLGTLADKARQVSAQLHEPTRGSSLQDATRSAIEEILQQDGQLTLSTGIPDLDERLGGGLMPGTLTVVIARSGHGKSCVAATAAWLASGEGRHRSLIVSREMPASEVAMRIAAIAQSSSVIRQQVRASEQSVIDRMLQDADSPIEIRDDLAHMDAIAGYIERERMRDAPFKLVVLDYLQMLQAEGREQHERLERIAYGAKELSMRCKCAVLALAQVNRVGSKMDGLPTMHDIRGSSSIENAADSIVTMERHDPIREGAPYGLNLRIEKARNGKPGGLGGEYELGAGTFRVSQDQSERNGCGSTGQWRGTVSEPRRDSDAADGILSRHTLGS